MAPEHELENIFDNNYYCPIIISLSVYLLYSQNRKLLTALKRVCGNLIFLTAQPFVSNHGMISKCPPLFIYIIKDTYGRLCHFEVSGGQ